MLVGRWVGSRRNACMLCAVAARHASTSTCSLASRTSPVGASSPAVPSTSTSSSTSALASPCRPYRRAGPHCPLATADPGRESRGAQSRCRCGGGEPSPGADVAGESPVPVQLWQGRGDVAGAQSRCGRGRVTPGMPCRRYTGEVVTWEEADRRGRVYDRQDASYPVSPPLGTLPCLLPLFVWARATSAPGPGSPLPHLHRDWAHPRVPPPAPAPRPRSPFPRARAQLCRARHGVPHTAHNSQR